MINIRLTKQTEHYSELTEDTMCDEKTIGRSEISENLKLVLGKVLTENGISSDVTILPDLFANFIRS